MRISYPRPRGAPRWLAALVLLAACENGTEPGSETLSEPEAVAIAAFVAGQPAVPSGQASSGASTGAFGAPPVSFTFSRTVDCPGGGSTTITGSGNRTPDDQIRETAVEWTKTVTHTNCTFTRDQRTLTLDGSLTGNGTARYAWPPQPGGSFTLLEFSVTRTGTLNWRAGDRSGSCAISLTTTYNRQTDQYSTTGTICGRQVSNSTRPAALGA